MICGMVDATAIVGRIRHDVRGIGIGGEKFVVESSIFTTNSDGETH